MGSVALALFAIIFFRLWFLQVLSGDQYLAKATVNRVRNVGIPAERGDIVDRSGATLVDSRRALSVQSLPRRYLRQRMRATICTGASPGS